MIHMFQSQHNKTCWSTDKNLQKQAEKIINISNSKIKTCKTEMFFPQKKNYVINMKFFIIFWRENGWCASLWNDNLISSSCTTDHKQMDFSSQSVPYCRKFIFLNKIEVVCLYLPLLNILWTDGYGAYFAYWNAE